MKLNDKIARMKHLRDDYRHLDAESKALKEEYKAIEAEVIQELQDSDLTQAGNKLASASLTEEDFPTVDPVYWTEVRAWLTQEGYDDCLGRRLNSAPVKELWAMGIEIPHVTKFKKQKLSLSSKSKL